MATEFGCHFFMPRPVFIGWLCVLLFSCTEKHAELQNHWVSIEYLEGKEFKTIDFEREVMPSTSSELDTFHYYINFNKNSFAGGGIGSFVVEIEDGYEFYTPHYESSMKITFKGDTLRVRGAEYHYYDGDFVKIDVQKSIHDELFNGTNIVGRLASFKTGDSVLNLKRTLISSINIGKGKSDPVESDSVRINVWDVYISLEELPKFVSRQKDGLPETDRQKLKILINADSSVSQEFLYNVISQVNKADSTLKIYRSTFDYKAKKVYYRPLNQ